MPTWAEFGAAAPDLGCFGRRRLEGRVAYLATIRRDGSPRVHPVSPFIGGGSLLVYMEPNSPKVRDLRRDDRYALHCGVENDDGGEGEFYVSGRAFEVCDSASRAAAFDSARAVGYQPTERHVVFELNVESVLCTVYGERRTQKRWPAIRPAP